MKNLDVLRNETKQAFKVFMNDKTKANLEAYKQAKQIRDNYIKNFTV